MSCYDPAPLVMCAARFCADLDSVEGVKFVELLVGAWPHSQQVLFVSRLASEAKWEQAAGIAFVKSSASNAPTRTDAADDPKFALRPTFIAMADQVPDCASRPAVDAVADLASVKQVSVKEMKEVVRFVSSATGDGEFARKVVDRLAKTSHEVKVAMALGLHH
jgi:hypothetical protein